MTEHDSITVVMLSPTRDSVIISNDAISGADVRMLHFLRFCESKNIRVHLITNSYGEKILKGKVSADFTIVRVPSIVDDVAKLDVVKSFLLLPLLSLRALLSSKSCVIVGSTSLLPDAIPISIVGVFGRTTWVYFHHWIHLDGLKELPRKLIQIASLSMLSISGVNFLSLPSSLQFVSRLAGNDRVREFENGVDLNAAKSSLKSSYDVDVLSVGRLSIKKGSRDIVEIWKRVLHLDPSRRLTIAGAIEDEDFIEIIKKEGIDDSVKVLGPVSEDDKIRLFTAAKCFISASREEGWGMAVSEALAFGSRVVVYNLPAYEHLSGGINRVALGDYDSFARLVIDGSKEVNFKTNLKDWEVVLKSELDLFMRHE